MKKTLLIFGGGMFTGILFSAIAAGVFVYKWIDHVQFDTMTTVASDVSQEANWANLVRSGNTESYFKNVETRISHGLLLLEKNKTDLDWKLKATQAVKAYYLDNNITPPAELLPLFDTVPNTEGRRYKLITATTQN
jgi:hypothetical protein